MSDDSSVLGSLPRSRAATRSPRRAGQAPTDPVPEVGSDGRGRTVTEGEALGGALRAAGQVAGAALGVASRAAGGVLGRIPRR